MTSQFTSTQFSLAPHEFRKSQLSISDGAEFSIEGQELAALEGAEATIRRHRPVLICEIHRGQHVRYRPWEVVHWLMEQGYGVVRLSSDSNPGISLAAALDRLDAVEPEPAIMHVLHIVARPT